MRKRMTIILAFLTAISLVAAAQTRAQGNAPKNDTSKAQTAKTAHQVNHHDGRQLLGDKIKTNGTHVLDTKGAYTTSVDVSGGKVAAFHVKHATKGDVPVTKYKTHMKVVQASVPSIVYASLTSAQDTYLGIEYIGYSYVDEFGNEEIYWFPYDVILDGETGAIEYVPTT